jgi:phenylacetic acid degradation operon negative regulatory protein
LPGPGIRAITLDEAAMTTAEIDRKEADSPKLPRRQQGSQPQHLLLTILGDFWYARRECLPTRALVSLLGEFGVSHQGSRTAISRLVHRGLLEFNRTRGTGGYQLTSYADWVLRDGLRRISQFGSSSKDWDGEWTLVTFSIPESQRHLRHMLRTRLRWLGFAPLYNGSWVSPWDRAGEVAQLLSELDIFSVSIFHARLSTSSPDSPVSAWDLDALARAFDEFIEEFAPLLERVRAGEIGSAEALRQRTFVMDAWRRFPGIDPDLPVKLLPDNFPRDRAHAVFSEIYRALGPMAESRVRHLLAQCAPEEARLASHHTLTT